MSSTVTTTPHPLPILLLKSPSPSPPTDPYTLTAPANTQPTYIPVLTHTLLPDPLIALLLSHFSPSPTTTPFPYGALIFTSQRSVAAFSTALKAPALVALKERLKRGLEGVRVYVVGPATERARRDVLTRMLMDEGLEEGQRVRVDEVEVYRTGQLEEFEFLFTQAVARVGRERGVMWVVVFSPTAGEGMLRGLGWLDEGSGRVKACVRDVGRKTFVACIGPTTRDYLVREFGFEADVVAKKPSPQGVKEGIEGFMKERGL
ncbi:tetrapyrrole biosynthesis, uroporphyrinogen III synthase [Usnea florida]